MTLCKMSGKILVYSDLEFPKGSVIYCALLDMSKDMCKGVFKDRFVIIFKGMYIDMFKGMFKEMHKGMFIACSRTCSKTISRAHSRSGSRNCS